MSHVHQYRWKTHHKDGTWSHGPCPACGQPGARRQKKEPTGVVVARRPLPKAAPVAQPTRMTQAERDAILRRVNSTGRAT